MTELDQQHKELTRLRRDSELLQQVLASRSWRWTRPFRVLARVLRHRGFSHGERIALRLWIRRLLRKIPMLGAWSAARSLPVAASTVRQQEDLLTAEDLLRLRICPAAPGLRNDVYFWGVIDWHFRTQRPQHLARSLSRSGHRVFYISNNFLDDESPGFAVEPLDETMRLFQVNLHLAGAPSIYVRPPNDEQRAQLALGLRQLEKWHGGGEALSIVQHPFWTMVASRPPVSRIVYDCMDHHLGFDDSAAGIAFEEKRLIAAADLVVVTSQWLAEEVGNAGKHIALIRNAAEFEHFNKAPRTFFVDRDGRKVLGYYGAIANWFDLDLIRKVAAAFPEALVVLVGSDTVGAADVLADLPNVRLTGEVSYAELPYWLHGFDVCLLPFKVIPLTLATNPVKIYEYLSAGKPVVAVNLPEMQQFNGLVEVASNHEAFIAAVGRQLADEPKTQEREARRMFASGQTWQDRAHELDTIIAHVRLPLVSVIVVTYNNLDYTKACLESVTAFSAWAELEVIVVDNASSDGTQDFLREWASNNRLRSVILNERNLGFAAANNQGLAAAKGAFFILLNNDTYVTRGWIRGLVTRISFDPTIGLIGPVTNNIGNEARIESDYAGMTEMAEFAEEFTARHAGRMFEIDKLAFFCVAMPRSTYEVVGPLDEAFGTGFFEDDDYCRRVQGQGLRCVCVEDVFVHHHLSASFDALKAEQRQALFERNRKIYEAKWGPWEPHSYRRSTADPE